MAVRPLHGCEYHRGPEAGWHLAEVHGLSRRPLRFNLVRSMDHPSCWRIEPAYVWAGVSQDPVRVRASARFLDDHMLGPNEHHATLSLLKSRLEWAARDARREGFLYYWDEDEERL